MKHQNIFWGVVLILIGSLVLLDRLGLFIFEWVMVRRLWPVLLILWGVSILPTKGFIKLILAFTVAALSVVIYQQRAPESHTDWKRFEFKKERRIDHKNNISQHFSEPFDDSIQLAKLKLDAGAGNFKLSGHTNELFEFSKSSSLMKYEFRVESLNEEASIFISQNTNIVLGKNNKNDVEIMLNPKPIWAVTFGLGAGNFNFDFSEIKVKKLELDGGAASIDFKMSELMDETDISINTAASSIKLRLPEGAGATLKSNAVLSSRNLNGFEQLSRGHYRTPGFDDAAQKFTINMDAAVSSFTVIWY